MGRGGASAEEGYLLPVHDRTERCHGRIGIGRERSPSAMGGEGGGRDEESSSSAVAAASAFGGGGEIASAVVDLGYDRDEREGRRIDEAKSSSTVVASTTTAGRRKRATSSLRAAKKKVSAKRRRRTKKKGGVWKEILLPHAPSLDDGWRRRPIRGETSICRGRAWSARKRGIRPTSGSHVHIETGAAP